MPFPAAMSLDRWNWKLTEGFFLTLFHPIQGQRASRGRGLLNKIIVRTQNKEKEGVRSVYSEDM